MPLNLSIIKVLDHSIEIVHHLCYNQLTSAGNLNERSWRVMLHKNKLFCVICIVLSSAVMLILSGCDSAKIDPRRPLEEIQDNYSLDDAIADGCLIIEDGKVANLEVLEQFTQDVKDRGHAFLRKFDCDNLTIDPDYDPEYYNSVKDDYPKITVHDIVYENGLYSVSSYDEDGNLTVREFPYFEQQYISPPNQYSAIVSGTAYFLCERDDILYQYILNAHMQGGFPAFPDYYTICMTYVYKDGY